MNFCFKTCAVALLWLLAAVSCAPTGQSPQDACADARRSSLELNRLAKNASFEARKRDKSESNFTTSLAWMEAKDMCSPEALKQTSSTCTAKMLEVLRSYNSYVERIHRFTSCSQYTKIVRPAVHNFLRDMSKCVTNHHQESDLTPDDNQPIVDLSLEPPLCHYILDRLFSFSIISARVFAEGDPARHSAGSTLKCI